MRVIVDTCIWSQALRKSTKKNQSNNAHLSQLAKESRIVMIGAIRQEVLSGPALAITALYAILNLTKASRLGFLRHPNLLAEISNHA